MLSFYEALVISAVGLTIFYLLCLLLPHKKDASKPLLQPNRWLLLICAAVLLLFSLSPLALSMQGPRPLWFFVFLVVTFIISYVTVIVYRSWKLALLVNVLIAATFTLSIFSALGAADGGTALLSDGFDIGAKYIMRDGNFTNAWLNEPYFQFFPATSTIYASLSLVADLNVSTSFVILGILQTALFATVITLFLKFFSGSPAIAALALPFILSSPRLGVWQPHASFLSLLFAAMLIYLLLLRLAPTGKEFGGKIFPVLFVLLGVSSIVHHTSGALFVVVLIGAMIMFEIIHRRLHRQALLDWWYGGRVLSFFLVLALAYWVYTFALYSMVPRVRNTVNGLIDFLLTGNPVYNYTPKQTLESPIQAYSWAVPVAIVTAFAIVSLIQYFKKSGFSVTPKKQYTNLVLVSAAAVSIPIVLSAFAFKLATTAASSERYFSASVYLLILFASPLIIQKMANTKIMKSLVFCSIVGLLFIGATSYTWNIDSVVGETIDVSESTGVMLSKMVADDTTIYSKNPYIITQLDLNGNLTFREGTSKVFDDLQQGENIFKADPKSHSTLYVSDPSTLQAVNATEINVLYASGRYDVFSP